MNPNFSDKLQEVLSYSKEEAVRLGNEFISPDHLFLGLIRDGKNHAFNALKTMEVDTEKIKLQIENHLRQEKFLSHKQAENLALLKTAERVLKLVTLEAKYLKSKEVDPEHLLLAICKDNSAVATQILRDLEIDYMLTKETLYKMKTKPKPEVRAEMPYDDDEGVHENRDNSSKQYSKNQNTETPVLDNFGIDLTKAAEESRLDPIVGREKEIERIAQILSRRKKNNPILIGEPGVGKSAIAEGLAMRIVKKQVSRILFNKRVITLDMASIVAGTKYRGQFEERMKAMLNEISRARDIILFIDEIHTIVGAGGASGSLDAANMLKPALARGEIQCIGATTLDEYRQHIEKDGALERRFQKVLVEPASEEEAIEILNNIKEHYEEHHGVEYTSEAISSCVSLTQRYITDRHLPDKAIDALDEAGSRVHISNIKVPEHIVKLEAQLEEIKKSKIDAVKSQNFELAASFRDKEKDVLNEIETANTNWQTALAEQREPVTDDDVAQVIAMMTGVPVQRIAQEEGTRLLKMFEELKGKVVGQDDALKKICKAIQRNRAGLKDPNRPIGSFIFLGPTGVGKTQLAKVLAEYLFDSTDALIRIDMSEYMEKFAVSRLIGAPPGYVGYEEGGQLTEKVRRKPYSVVLLDEIEKAHPDVFNILLQVLDEGRLTDSLGRVVDFRNTIIVMTSNVGARELTEFNNSVGFSTKSAEERSDDYARSVFDKALKRSFSPEFLNRIDDMVRFNSLTQEDIHKIIDIELVSLFERISSLEFKLEISDVAKKYIVENGFDLKFGARPLKRSIQKYLEDPIAEFMLSTKLAHGDVIKIDLDEENKKIVVSK